MSYLDLPDDWPHRPLVDPTFVHDVLDLVVGHHHRLGGGLAVILGDAGARMRQPCFVEDLPLTPGPEDCHRVLEPFVRLLSDGGVGRGSLLLAVARELDPEPGPTDERWRAAAAAVCGRAVRLLGVHVVTTQGIRLVPPTAEVA